MITSHEPYVIFQEAFGFIERADVVKEIFFHYSEFKGDLEALQAGDDVEFTIKDRNVGIKFLASTSPRITSEFRNDSSLTCAVLCLHHLLFRVKK